MPGAGRRHAICSVVDFTYHFPVLAKIIALRGTMRAFLLSAVLFFPYLAPAQLGDILKQADETLNHRGTAGLSNDKIIAGLKEALRVSTSKAVALTGKPDGFLKNEAIKILLPPKLQSIGRGLRMLGMG